MKGEYTSKQLRRRLQTPGAHAYPVFGRPQGQKPVEYKPRVNHDPKPWTDGFFRYQAWELTVEQTDMSPEAVEMRHLLEDHSPLDIAFSHLAEVAV